MSKGKMITIGIIAVIIAICLGIFAYFSSTTNNTDVTIDLNSLNQKLSTNSTFTSTRMDNIDINNVSDIFGINKEDVDEVIGKIPTVNIKASMYVVIKAKDGKQQVIKEKLQEYASNYEEQWSKYLENEYQLVKDRKIDIKGSYIYLLIGNNIKEIEELIK